MLSDTLANTFEAIERYVRVNPECYGEPAFAARLEKLKNSIDTLRNEIDTTPTIKGQEDMARRAGRI